MKIKEYLMPRSVDECLSKLSEFEGRGRLIAGGTDLVSNMERQKVRAEALIDITSIEELAGFHIDDSDLTINAGATHAQISLDERVREILPALAQACGSVGSPQIRNVATVAGNVVNAQPAADAAVALCALGAKVKIASASGRRIEAIENLYAGLGQSKINSSREILTAIKIRLPRRGQANAYGRISPRNSLCLPIVNAAVSIEVKEGKIQCARLAMGPVADRPFRSLKAEETLRGVALDDTKSLSEAAMVASAESNPRNSCLRGCSDYRRQLLQVLVRTILEKATARVVG